MRTTLPSAHANHFKCVAVSSTHERNITETCVSGVLPQDQMNLCRTMCLHEHCFYMRVCTPRLNISGTIRRNLRWQKLEDFNWELESHLLVGDNGPSVVPYAYCMLTLEDRSETSWCYWNTDFVQLALSRASTCCSSDSNKGRLVLRMGHFREPNPTPKTSSSPNETDNQPTVKTWTQNSFPKFSCQSSLLLKKWGVQNPAKQKGAGEEITKGLFRT